MYDLKDLSTYEKAQLAYTMYNEGISPHQIGLRLGVTKNHAIHLITLHNRELVARRFQRY